MIHWKRIVFAALIGPLAVPAFAHYGHEDWAPGNMPMGDQDEMYEHMQENMEQMNELMQSIHQETSVEKRQELMQEHMDLMQRYMYRMHGGMMGSGMMGPGMMGGAGMMSGQNQGMMGQGRSAGAGDQELPAMTQGQRVQQLEQRMDQMQLMMEQILQNQREMMRDNDLN